MDDMKIGNVVHEMLPREAKISIDGRGGAFEERPGIRRVLGDGGERVVQVGDCDDPVVHPEVGLDIVEEDNGKRCESGGVVECQEGEGNSNV